MDEGVWPTFVRSANRSGLGWYGGLHDVHEEILAKQKAEALIAHLDDAVRTRASDVQPSSILVRPSE